MLTNRKLFACGFALFTVAFGTAQDQSPTPKVSAKFAKIVGMKGGKLWGSVAVEFAPGMHGYQNPPSDKFSIPVSVKVETKGFRLLKAKYPVGTDLPDQGTDKPTKVYDGKISIPIVVGLPKSAGVYTLKIAVHYQQCTATSCGPPADAVTSVTVKVSDH